MNKTGQKMLFGESVKFSGRKSIIFTDNKIQADALGIFFKNLARSSLRVFKNQFAINVIKFPAEHSIMELWVEVQLCLKVLKQLYPQFRCDYLYHNSKGENPWKFV